MNVTHLECALCQARYQAAQVHQLCVECNRPLLVRYDLRRAAQVLTKTALEKRQFNMWRYREVLPVEHDEHIVSLGEGGTPLINVPRLARRVGINRLLIKDESQNPTQSFKARGMSAAVSMAYELGIKRLAAPSAGNAGGALAAYAARAGIEAHIFMPRDTPRANIIECGQTGAQVTLIDGLITDCGAEVARRKNEMQWFDVSTLKEPYRVEGKKTLGYELAEQLEWRLPDVIVYPTGGGTGLIGMWKAFDEMEQLGWIGSARPRMISVQSAGCAPIVRAFAEGSRFADEFLNAATLASGLRVPRAVGDFLILDALRASGGMALAVTDEEIMAAVAEIGASEGLFVAPEGAACLPALRQMLAQAAVRAEETVVLFNTGAGVKYLESFGN